MKDSNRINRGMKKRKKRKEVKEKEKIREKKN